MADSLPPTRIDIEFGSGLGLSYAYLHAWHFKLALKLTNPSALPLESCQRHQTTRPVN